MGPFFFFSYSVVVVVVDSPGIIKDLSIYDRFPPLFFLLRAGLTKCQRPSVIMIGSRSEGKKKK